MLRKILVVAAALLVLLLAFLGFGLWRVLHGGLPQREGTARVEGLAASVEVRWDAWAVPHVVAEREVDLAAALGWLHANDRFSQMELARRSVAGRLAEVFGEAALESDIDSRTMRYREIAEGWWRAAGGETRAWLEAYAGGVNAWLAACGDDLPPLLALFGVEPEPWTPVDSLGYAVLMARDLAFWQGRPEEIRFEWLRELGVQKTLQLVGDDVHVAPRILELASGVALPEPEEAPAETAVAAAPSHGKHGRGGSVARNGWHLGQQHLDQAPSPETAGTHVPQVPWVGRLVASAFPEVAGTALGSAALDGAPFGRAARGSNRLGDAAPGSNNWALGVSRTTGGLPLVANDPHLALRLPGVWFEAHLSAPGLEVAGMTLPGLPGVVIGHTAHLAWALTNVMLDDHDLFFERLDDAGTAVRRGEAWVPIEVVRESIPIRGGRAHEIELRSTDRGPLLAADAERALPARSITWSAQYPADPLAAFLHLARAERVEEIAAGIGDFVAPAQNLVVADRAGGLLQTVLGRFPERRLGDGRLPSPGWDERYGWSGLEPLAAKPLRLAPVDDLLVTANHDTRPPGSTRRISADWDLPARADRIRHRLGERPAWSAEELAEVQTDIVSLYAREMVTLARGAHEGNAREAFETLDAWDGGMRADDGRAALFKLFERQLAARVFGDEIDVGEMHEFPKRSRLLELLRGEMSAAWFDDVTTPGVETRDEIVGAALAAALDEGHGQWDGPVTGWNYGGFHTLTLRHPLGLLPLLGRLVDRGPLPLPGSATTVAAFGGRWQGDRRVVTYGPSMRWIARPGAEAARAVLPGGQSGHPFDRHYDDQLELYLAGALRVSPWSEAAVREATVSRLRLDP